MLLLYNQIRLQLVIMDGLDITDPAMEYLIIGGHGTERSALVETPEDTSSESTMIMSNTFCQIMFVQSAVYVMLVCYIHSR